MKPVSPRSNSFAPTAAIRDADWHMPDLDHEHAVVAGVASGTARELGVPRQWIRLAFIILFTVKGLGGFVYVGLWALLRWAHSSGISPRRATEARDRGRSELHRFAAVVLITIGIAIGGASLMPADTGLGYGIALILMGLGLAWRTSSMDQNEMPGRQRLRQLAGGLVAVAVGLSLVLSRLDALPLTLGVGIIVLVGTIVVAGPWLYQVLADFDAERQARIRSDERAELGAHLHDSVLQTLALIQKADDPQTARTLARRQERELRNWLDPNRASRIGGSIRGRLDELVSEVEELYGVPVEVVAVGDTLIDERIEPLLMAAREATVNAARHSGTPRVDIFLEVAGDRIEIFVRDTGKGFDRSKIPGDRRGVSQSIIGRMERAGGSATITTDIGEGSEVELVLELDQKDLP
ncbi:MAG: PspC domain-containing protein [Acidimicrobiales bacterium]|nr:PspC domain-containing protein [Acidimicrobiales bacterium]